MTSILKCTYKVHLKVLLMPGLYKILGILKPCSGPNMVFLGIGSDPYFSLVQHNLGKDHSSFGILFLTTFLEMLHLFWFLLEMLLYCFLAQEFLSSSKPIIGKEVLSQVSLYFWPVWFSLSVQGPIPHSLSAWCCGNHWIWSQKTQVLDLILLHPYCMTFGNTLKLMCFFTWKWD